MTHLLDVDQVAEVVGLSPLTVRRALREGDLVGSKLRGRWRIDPANVAAWIDQTTHQPGRTPATRHDLAPRARTTLPAGGARLRWWGFRWGRSVSGLQHVSVQAVQCRYVPLRVRSRIARREHTMSRSRPRTWVTIITPASPTRQGLCGPIRQHPRVQWINAETADDAAELASPKPGESVDVVEGIHVVTYDRALLAPLVKVKEPKA